MVRAEGAQEDEGKGLKTFEENGVRSNLEDTAVGRGATGTVGEKDERREKNTVLWWVGRTRLPGAAFAKTAKSRRLRKN